MRFFLGVTDYDWFRLHASKSVVEKANCWRPSPEALFKTLQSGEPFLFKLHTPRLIAGGGSFAKFLTLPVTLALRTLRRGNGAHSLTEVKQRIGR